MIAAGPSPRGRSGVDPAAAPAQEPFAIPRNDPARRNLRGFSGADRNPRLAHARAYRDRRPAARAERDRAAADALAAVQRGGDLDLPEDRLQRDPHLELRERRAEAAAHAAAERDPAELAGRAVEEALGTERVGLRIDALVVVHEVDAADQRRAGLVRVAADLDRLLDPPRLGDREHGAAAEDLLHGGLEVRGVVLDRRLGHARERGGRAHELLEAPRERRGGRLVPGDEQRDELVAQLAVGHRPAGLVARREQHGHHVVALHAGAAALVDQREDEGVGAVADLDEALPGGEPAEVAAEQRQQRERRRAEVEQLLQRGPQLVQLRPGGHAEHGAHHHLERQRLRALMERERRAGAPSRDLRRGDLLHHAREGAHALAVEGGQHQLALGEVLGAVEQQHGPRADDRLEHACALARVQDVGGRGEHLADLVGLREEDPLALGRAHVDREAIAVARAALLHERHGPQRPAEQVRRDRPRPGGGAHAADRRGASRYPAAAVTHRTLLLLVVLALALAGCGDDGETAAKATATPKATPTPSNTDLTKKPVVTVPDELPPDTLQKRDIVVGKGPVAKTGDTVSVQYVGVAWSTGQEFDASWDRGQPFTVKLGEGNVIKGWDEGIPGMRKGGRRELTIPAAQAYGAQGQPPIGPNECLRFIVDLVDLKKKG